MYHYDKEIHTDIIDRCTHVITEKKTFQHTVPICHSWNIWVHYVAVFFIFCLKHHINAIVWDLVLPHLGYPYIWLTWWSTGTLERVRESPSLDKTTPVNMLHHDGGAGWHKVICEIVILGIPQGYRCRESYQGLQNRVRPYSNMDDQRKYPILKFCEYEIGAHFTIFQS